MIEPSQNVAAFSKELIQMLKSCGNIVVVPVVGIADCGLSALVSLFGSLVKTSQPAIGMSVINLQDEVRQFLMPRNKASLNSQRILGAAEAITLVAKPSDSLFIQVVGAALKREYEHLHPSATESHGKVVIFIVIESPLSGGQAKAILGLNNKNVVCLDCESNRNRLLRAAATRRNHGHVAGLKPEITDSRSHIERQLETDTDATKPSIKFLKTRGVEVHTIDCNVPMEERLAQICGALKQDGLSERLKDKSSAAAKLAFGIDVFNGLAKPEVDGKNMSAARLTTSVVDPGKEGQAMFSVEATFGPVRSGMVAIIRGQVPKESFMVPPPSLQKQQPVAAPIPNV